MAIDYDIAIIGGGASGLAAAVAAASAAQQAGTSLNIAILEADERVGRSILVTGNGRCNFTNEHIRPVIYRNAGFVQQTLGSLGNDDAIFDFFAQWGLEWRMDQEGRFYPLANKASVVLDVLRAAAAHLGVHELCGHQVVQVHGAKQADGHVTMHLSDTSLVRARSVIVACGGKATTHLEIDDLEKRPVKPTLGPLRCAEADRAFTHELDNVRVRCGIMLMRPDTSGGEPRCVSSEAGELLFRPYGVSGICVFNLSRLALPGDTLCLNLLQTSDFEHAVFELERRRRGLQQRFGQDFDHATMLRGLVLPRVADALLKRAGRQPSDAFSAEDVEALAQMLCCCELEVEGIGDVAQCQVQRGGFAIEGIDPQTMQARKVPGLYVAGEALDVDGPCGGFNLHWAWASGLLAGRCAAHALSGQPSAPSASSTSSTPATPSVPSEAASS